MTPLAQQRKTLRSAAENSLAALAAAGGLAMIAIMIGLGLELISGPESGLRFWGTFLRGVTLTGFGITLATWVSLTATALLVKRNAQAAQKAEKEPTLKPYRIEIPGEPTRILEAPSKELAGFLACAGNPEKRGMKITEAPEEPCEPDENGYHLAMFDDFIRQHYAIAPKVDELDLSETVYAIAAHRMTGFLA